MCCCLILFFFVTVKFVFLSNITKFYIPESLPWYFFFFFFEPKGKKQTHQNAFTVKSICGRGPSAPHGLWPVVLELQVVTGKSRCPGPASGILDDWAEQLHRHRDLTETRRRALSDAK